VPRLIGCIFPLFVRVFLLFRLRLGWGRIILCSSYRILQHKEACSVWLHDCCQARGCTVPAQNISAAEPCSCLRARHQSKAPGQRGTCPGSGKSKSTPVIKNQCAQPIASGPSFRRLRLTSDENVSRETHFHHAGFLPILRFNKACCLSETSQLQAPVSPPSG
jgi:hypothetical protein